MNEYDFTLIVKDLSDIDELEKHLVLQALKKSKNNNIPSVI